MVRGFGIKKLYQPPGVTVDVAIFTVLNNELKILLIKRNNNPFKGHWALPGGFLFKNETAQNAALRILKSKAGVNNVFIEQLYTFDGEERDPRGHIISISYFALVPAEKLKSGSEGDTQTPTLYPISKLPSLAFDHKKIMEYALKRLRYKFEYTNAAFSLLPKKFAISELQKIYEIVLGKKMDKRNFRKKILALNFIKKTNGVFSGARQRPAMLYKFAFSKPQELKRFF